MKTLTLDSSGSALSNDDLFITAASFEEERCRAVAERLEGYQARCTVMVVFRGRLSPEGDEKKARAIDGLVSALRLRDSTHIPRIISAARYDYGTVSAKLDEELGRRGINFTGASVAVDISSFTAVQLVFLLRELVFQRKPSRLRLFYTRPMRYNTKGDKFHRLGLAAFEPVPMPIIVRSRRSIGPIHRVAIALLGHEGQRTLCAWRQADPSETLLLFPSSRSRSLMETCKKENRFLMNGIDKGIEPGALLLCDSLDVPRTSSSLLIHLNQYQTLPSVRISLIPLGPKPILVGTVLALFAATKLDVELMYPIPTSYNPDYSEGVKGVLCYEYQRSDLPT